MTEKKMTVAQLEKYVKKEIAALADIQAKAIQRGQDTARDIGERLCAIEEAEPTPDPKLMKRIDDLGKVLEQIDTKVQSLSTSSVEAIREIVFHLAQKAHLPPATLAVLRPKTTE